MLFGRGEEGGGRGVAKSWLREVFILILTRTIACTAGRDGALGLMINGQRMCVKFQSGRPR